MLYSLYYYRLLIPWGLTHDTTRVALILFLINIYNNNYNNNNNINTLPDDSYIAVEWVDDAIMSPPRFPWPRYLTTWKYYYIIFPAGDYWVWDPCRKVCICISIWLVLLYLLLIRMSYIFTVQKKFIFNNNYSILLFWLAQSIVSFFLPLHQATLNLNKPQSIYLTLILFIYPYLYTLTTEKKLSRLLSKWNKIFFKDYLIYYNSFLCIE